MSQKYMMIADLPDPTDPKGRTYREINSEKKHAIPMGSLVETPDGARAFVSEHTRDCDMTPLYSLQVSDGDLGQSYGWSDDSLTIIKKHEVI